MTRHAWAAVALLLATGQGAAQEPPVPAGDHGVAQSAPPGPDGIAAPRTAGSPDLERRTSEVAAGLRCPVCQGVSVEDSPTDLARQMRATVRDQLASGKSPDEVRQYFVDRYGEWILLEPKASGFNLLVYVLPWLAMLAGLSVIVLAVRRWTRPLTADTGAGTAAVSPTIDS